MDFTDNLYRSNGYLGLYHKKKPSEKKTSCSLVRFVDGSSKHIKSYQAKPMTGIKKPWNKHNDHSGKSA